MRLKGLKVPLVCRQEFGLGPVRTRRLRFRLVKILQSLAGLNFESFCGRDSVLLRTTRDILEQKRLEIRRVVLEFISFKPE